MPFWRISKSIVYKDVYSLSYVSNFCPYLSISFPRFSTSTDATAHFRLGWGPSPQLFKVAQLAPWALVAVPMDSSSLGVWISLKFWWWYNMMIYVCWVLKYQKKTTRQIQDQSFWSCWSCEWFSLRFEYVGFFVFLWCLSFFPWGNILILAQMFWAWSRSWGQMSTCWNGSDQTADENELGWR